MKKSSLFLSITLALAVGAGSAAGSIIALDGPWYTGSNNGTPSISNPNSNSFIFGTPGGSETALTGLLWSYFPEQSLANDGDFIRVSFTAEWPTEATSGGGGLRFGLFDSNGSTLMSNLSGSNSSPLFADSRGYITTVNLGSSTGTGAFVRDAASNNPLSTVAGVENLGGSAINPNALPANTPYDFSMLITRNSASEYAISFEAASASLSTVTTNITADSFDSFFLLNTPQAGLPQIEFSNFQLQVIPEPSRAILLVVAGMAVVLRRRR